MPAASRGASGRRLRQGDLGGPPQGSPWDEHLLGEGWGEVAVRRAGQPPGAEAGTEPPPLGAGPCLGAGHPPGGSGTPQAWGRASQRACFPRRGRADTQTHRGHSLVTTGRGWTPGATGSWREGLCPPETPEGACPCRHGDVDVRPQSRERVGDCCVTLRRLWLSGPAQAENWVVLGVKPEPGRHSFSCRTGSVRSLPRSLLHLDAASNGRGVPCRLPKELTVLPPKSAVPSDSLLTALSLYFCVSRICQTLETRCL